MRSCSLRIEAFHSIASPNVHGNALCDGHLNRTTGIPQSFCFVRRIFLADEVVVMSCASFPNYDFFQGAGTPMGALLDKRLSYDSFSRFKIRKEGQRGRTRVVQAETVRTDIQEAVTAHITHYTVREGDTLTSIARMFNTTVQSIAVSNQIVDVDYIPAGMLLLISIHSRNPNEGGAKTSDMKHVSIPMLYPEDAKLSVSTHKGSLSSITSMISSPFYPQIVQVAVSFVVIFALFSFVKRSLSEFVKGKVHTEIQRSKIEKEIQDAHHRPKLRRWQGILDEDREKEDLDSILSADGQPPMKSQVSSEDSEEEKLRQSYAQLESVYAQFLADSGLSKSGYWRGGVPPASEKE